MQRALKTCCTFVIPRVVACADATSTQTRSQFDSGPTCLVRNETMPCDAGAEGWQFAQNPDGSDDKSQVVICGSACSELRNDPEAQVDVVFNCQELQVLQ